MEHYFKGKQMKTQAKWEALRNTLKLFGGELTEKAAWPQKGSSICLQGMVIILGQVKIFNLVPAQFYWLDSFIYFLEVTFTTFIGMVSQTFFFLYLNYIH